MMISLLGILTVIFFLLAGLNGLKKYIKNDFVLFFSKHHKRFGFLSIVTAIIHMTVAVSSGELRITGTIALLGVITTGALGFIFYSEKQKGYYLAHRIAGPVTFLLILIHILFNSNY
jgi:hypothetical protein